MGTRFHFDKMLPTTGADKRENPRSKRQLEIFIPSGTREINLRVGPVNEEHSGTGHCVLLSEKDAQDLLEGLHSAMTYVGYKTE
jgi:hypothetical protein